jgi:hypothetical protein
MNYDFASGVVLVSLAVMMGLLVLGLVHLRAEALRRGDRAAASAAIVLGTALSGWMLLMGVLAVRGFFVSGLDSLPPRVPVMLLTLLIIGALAVTVWPAGRRLVEAAPVSWLIGVQVYRTVGVTFLVLYAQHRLPGNFALPAGWGDIAVGVTAPFVAYLTARQVTGWRAWAMAWNILGALDLFVAILEGFGSFPSPFRLFFGEPSTLLMGAFPFALIPAVLVPMSLVLHFVVARRLRQTAPIAPTSVHFSV